MPDYIFDGHNAILDADTNTIIYDDIGKREAEIIVRLLDEIEFLKKMAANLASLLNERNITMGESAPQKRSQPGLPPALHTGEC